MNRPSDPQGSDLVRLTQAATNGDAKAQLELGSRYARGMDVAQDLAEAVKWFRMAAEQGDADAQLALGRCYLQGVVVTQDSPEEVEWFRMAAARGDVNAKLKLLGRYATREGGGEGVTQDLAEAVKWFRKAAEQGNPVAQTQLGLCYGAGMGVAQDSDEAMRWLHRAAQQDCADAMQLLQMLGTTVYPMWGSVRGGTPISIVGLNLGSTASVTVDGVLAPSVSVASATAVTAVTPAGSVGPKLVELRDSDGQVIASNSFTYAVTTLSWATVLEQLPDPAVVISPDLCGAITATGLPWRVRDNATQIELVLIPPGTYQRGCSPSSQPGCECSVEIPVQQVTLTEPFYLGRYEVTQSQWTARMGSNPSLHQSASGEVPVDQVPDRPVERVSWNMIQGFLSATGMRLPTEGEWEYAYRAGTTTAFHSMPGHPSGTDDGTLVGNIAWFGGNSEGQTRPVGQRTGNGLGVHDMSGNVCEWLSDWYSSGHDQSSPTTNPTGPESGSRRVSRGGSWRDDTCHMRSSSRDGHAPEDTHGNIGFRVARTHQGYPPTLAAISPASGPVAGGTTITLTGANLAGTTSVTVGGMAATNVQVVNPMTVTAMTPAGTADAGDVAVTTPAGTATRMGAFTYGASHVPPWATLLEAAPDPAVVTSPSLRSAISSTGYAWRVRDNATQIECVLIPPGTYQRGGSPSQQYRGSGRELPVHTVTLTQPFYMGRYEVTQAQWQARMGSNPSSFLNASTEVPPARVPDRPVERVSWGMAFTFLIATGLRLPTEAEWEYAYRAGTTTAFHSMPGHPDGTNDDSLVSGIAWCSGNSNGQTHPVGEKAGNGFGLHDMSGNVREWVSDRYGTYPSEAQVDPTGPVSGSSHVSRGGSWYSDTLHLRSSSRSSGSLGGEGGTFGFRVARNP